MRIAPSPARKTAAVGVCPYAHAFAEAAIASNAAGVVVSTLCDQMRRAAEVIESRGGAPVFLMNVPHTCETDGALRLYVSEIERMGRWLVEIGGEAPTSAALRNVMAGRGEPLLDPPLNGGENRIPIALVGGPVPSGSKIREIIGQAGGYVALDATETGERGRPGTFDEKLMRTEPLRALAEAYFRIPDISRRPNARFYEWFGARVAERSVRGVILRRYVWCDVWHAEAERMKEWLDVPFLALDVDDETADAARTLSRVQSLMEVLR